jgi:DNA-binding winged helix-turn-helix (wHTH) protein
MRHRFGDCVFDSATRRLARGGRPVHLSPKAYELLALLLERAPSAVSKEEIQAALWPETFVTDSSLTNAVAQARAAIGDDAREPELIRTVHGFGYAFAGAQARESDEPESERPRRFSHFRLALGNQRYALFEGENLLGRDLDAEVVLDHGSISRRHARITVRGEAATLEDLQSRHGTFRDGMRLANPIELRDGDAVTLGQVTLTIQWISSPGSTDSDLAV